MKSLIGLLMGHGIVHFFSVSVSKPFLKTQIPFIFGFISPHLVQFSQKRWLEGLEHYVQTHITKSPCCTFLIDCIMQSQSIRQKNTLQKTSGKFT